MASKRREIPLAANTRLLLERTGRTASSVAKQAGIPASTITAILHGDRLNPGVWTVASLAHAFGVTLAQFIGDAPMPVTPKDVIADNLPSWLGIKPRAPNEHDLRDAAERIIAALRAAGYEIVPRRCTQVGHDLNYRRPA